MVLFLTTIILQFWSLAVPPLWHRLPPPSLADSVVNSIKFNHIKGILNVVLCFSHWSTDIQWYLKQTLRASSWSPSICHLLWLLNRSSRKVGGRKKDNENNSEFMGGMWCVDVLTLGKRIGLAHIWYIPSQPLYNTKRSFIAYLSSDESDCFHFIYHFFHQFHPPMPPFVQPPFKKTLFPTCMFWMEFSILPSQPHCTTGGLV